MSGLLRRVREPVARNAQRCLFLDRDGVLNEHIESGYVLQWSDYAWRPGAIASLVGLADVGLPVAIVTNQSCIGRGLVLAPTIVSIMDRVLDALSEAGVRAAAWYCCPHAPADGCDCRKPAAGMLYAAAADLNVDLESSYLIGDSDSDISAGKVVGCATWQISDPVSLGAAINDVIARERLIATPHEVAP